MTSQGRLINNAHFQKDIVRNIFLYISQKNGRTLLIKANLLELYLQISQRHLTYGFTLPALRLIHDYLSNRKQRTKIDDNYSSWSEILFGVPQGSILGPLLFNIFLADLFFVVKDIDIASYADDSTPFIVKNNIDNVIASLEQVSDALFNWFKNNRLKNNVDKCHVLVSTSKPVGIKVGDYTIDNSECEKLLGVKIDVNLNFNDHISDLCKKASRKISALARVTPFMGLSKRKLLMNAFFIS